MRRRWWWIAGLGSALVGVVAVGVMAAGREKVPVVTAEVERREFVRTVYSHGVLEAVESTPINVPTSLTRPAKVAWFGEEGSRVKAGDVVLRLDPTDFESELRDGLSGEEASAQRIAKARAALDATLRQLGLDADMARLERQVASEFQLLDEEIFSRFERIESALDLELSESRLRHAETVRQSKRELSDADLKLLQLERQQAERRVQQARQGLESIEIEAPHDGIFLLKRTGWLNEPLKVGDMAWPGLAVAEIPALAAMQALVHVLEADAGGLAPGQSAQVIVDAAPARTWNAEVIQVEPVAKPWVPGSPVQYFGVTLRLERTDPEIMKPGQRVQAQIEAERILATLVVPRSAIVQREGESVVYRHRGELEAVPVEVVSAGLGWAAVDGALQEGDKVALEDPGELERSGSASAEGADVDAQPAGQDRGSADRPDEGGGRRSQRVRE